MLIDGEGRRRGGQEGVAVRVRAIEQIARDVLGGARMWLHDGGLAPFGLKALTDDAGQKVRRAAGGHGNDYADRPVRRPILRMGDRPGE